MYVFFEICFFENILYYISYNIVLYACALTAGAPTANLNLNPNLTTGASTALYEALQSVRRPRSPHHHPNLNPNPNPNPPLTHLTTTLP